MYLTGRETSDYFEVLDHFAAERDPATICVCEVDRCIEFAECVCVHVVIIRSLVLEKVSADTGQVSPCCLTDFSGDRFSQLLSVSGGTCGWKREHRDERRKTRHSSAVR